MLCYDYENETELVVGWLEDELMRILRFLWSCCVRREPGLCLAAIVWIARRCGAYSAELIMKCLNVLHANSFPFHVIKHHLASKVAFEKESFLGCN